MKKTMNERMEEKRTTVKEGKNRKIKIGRMEKKDRRNDRIK